MSMFMKNKQEVLMKLNLNSLHVLIVEINGEKINEIIFLLNQSQKTVDLHQQLL